jgi:hypothetical protein
MIYRLLADAAWLLHLAFIVSVAAGGLFLLRWPRLSWLPWLHPPAVLWGASVEPRGDICPLTPKGNRRRQLGGEAGYAGGFVKHYHAGLTREWQIARGLGVATLNLAPYVRWQRQRRN